MARLFRIDAEKGPVQMPEKPFASEVGELEPLVRDNPQVLGDFVVFSEQPSSAGGAQRLDLLAMDRDRQVWIIELKRDAVDEHSLTQAMKYRTHWRRNLEAVRNLWHSYARKLQKTESTTIEPDWKGYDPRILLVAPEVDEETVEIARAHNLPIDFLSLRRYEHIGQTYLIVDEVEAEAGKPAPAAGREQYDWTWYDGDGDEAYPEQVATAKRLTEQILQLSERNGWNLKLHFNKAYVALKKGLRNATWLDFRRVRNVAVCVNLREQAKRPTTSTSHEWRWDPNFGHWYLLVETADENFKADDIEATLDLACKSTPGV